MHPQETIVALSSAPGGASRAVVRLTGPQALQVALTTFSPAEDVRRTYRVWIPGQICLEGIASPLPAELMYWPAPRTYTGQEMAEIHTVSSLPLLDMLVAQLLSNGGRAAQPGEFTLRAFLAGKLDLTRAEAVLAVIESSSRGELRRALAQLAGGIAEPLQILRGELLDLLADVEAGLDFADEDIRFVDQTQLLNRLARALAQLTLLKQQLEKRGSDRDTFRAVLAGRPSVGKSSLFNALAGLPLAMVSPTAGTTRDYLSRRLTLLASDVELIDSAGWQAEEDSIASQAGELSRKVREQAELVLLCVEAGRPLFADEEDFLRGTDQEVVLIQTKCELTPGNESHLMTSARTGAGIDALKRLLDEKARVHHSPALAPSQARCRHHLDACLQFLRQAHAAVLEQDPPELLALSLRETLEALGAMAGTVYTDDLLDRIFSRFCIGK